MLAFLFHGTTDYTYVTYVEYIFNVSLNTTELLVESFQIS